MTVQELTTILRNNLHPQYKIQHCLEINAPFVIPAGYHKEYTSSAFVNYYLFYKINEQEDILNVFNVRMSYNFRYFPFPNNKETACKREYIFHFNNNDTGSNVNIFNTAEAILRLEGIRKCAL